MIDMGNELIAIIRIRGNVKVKSTINDTMGMLNLTRTNHCTFYKTNVVLEGMLKKAKDYITFGTVNKETLMKVFKKRGRITGNRKITEEFLKEKKLDWDKLIDMFINDPKDVYNLGIKKVFRLSPPSKGFERKGIKLPFTVGGVLGNRKEKVNDLIEKMA